MKFFSMCHTVQLLLHTLDVRNIQHVYRYPHNKKLSFNFVYNSFLYYEHVIIHKYDHYFSSDIVWTLEFRPFPPTCKLNYRDNLSLL